MRLLKIKGIVAIASISLLAMVAGYVLALRSAAYGRATVFVTTTPFIKQQLGTVRHIQLHFFGYSIRLYGASGRAEFSCSLDGARGTAEVDVVLVKNVGIWKISAAALNGKPIPIPRTR